jgi:hypothetical protein
VSGRTFRRVQIEWVDSVSDGSWCDYDHALAQAASSDVMDCTSIGLLLSDSDNYILLATSYMRDGDLVQGRLQIPREAIREIRELRK